MSGHLVLTSWVASRGFCTLSSDGVLSLQSQRDCVREFSCPFIFLVSVSGGLVSLGIFLLHGSFPLRSVDLEFVLGVLGPLQYLVLVGPCGSCTT